MSSYQISTKRKQRRWNLISLNQNAFTAYWNLVSWHSVFRIWPTVSIILVSDFEFSVALGFERSCRYYSCWDYHLFVGLAMFLASILAVHAFIKLNWQIPWHVLWYIAPGFGFWLSAFGFRFSASAFAILQAKGSASTWCHLFCISWARKRASRWLHSLRLKSELFNLFQNQSSAESQLCLVYTEMAVHQRDGHQLCVSWAINQQC